MGLFSRDTRAPLPDRLRPTTLDEVVGHDDALAPLCTALSTGELGSVVLWGPPGCGKTTVARCLAKTANARFLPLSAVLDGVKELRVLLEQAQQIREREGRTPVLFVDEIHRWNKAQQDALLPHLETGAVVLVGATTENPSFRLNPALRSRVQLVHLAPLPAQQVEEILLRGEAHLERSLHPDARTLLARRSAGDARRALGDLERLAQLVDGEINVEEIRRHTQATLRHDRDGDDHYAVMSALIKSMRGSDPDASLYWLARLLEAGEDPISVARRIVIFAAEDIGNADPRGLDVAVAAARAAQMVGMPEIRIVLGQAVTWLACSPKSNAAYRGIDAAIAAVRAHGSLPVPLHLRNPTAATRSLGYGDGYLYPHDAPYRVVDQAYLPEALMGARFYEPVDHGEERLIRERLEWWSRKRRE